MQFPIDRQIIDPRLLRSAKRKGYRLTKHHGRYFLADPSTSTVVVGSPHGWSADYIAEFLAKN